MHDLVETQTVCRDPAVSTQAAPAPLKLRACQMPPRHLFPEHSHASHQLAYAVEGVLTVAVPGSCFVIAPEQAIWIPGRIPHRIGSVSGAKFRSLYVADRPDLCLASVPTVLGVTALLREAIVEAVSIKADEAPADDRYAQQIVELILSQLRRAKILPSALPWPTSKSLTELCEALYADPSDCRSLEDCAKAAAMSERTFSRRFEQEVGMSFGAWRRRLRLFEAIEQLAKGIPVTQVALNLGYSSVSAFIHRFRVQMGATPREFMRTG